MSFKVEIRKDCKICGNLIVKKGYRTFCSRTCRNKNYAQKYRTYRSMKQRERNDHNALVSSPNKVKCLICGRYYIQVGTHIVERHQMTAREYREEYKLPVKRGIIPKWYRELKAEQTMKNKTFENLKRGKPYRYKKRDQRAIINTYFKGRASDAKKLSQEIYPH